MLLITVSNNNLQLFKLASNQASSKIKQSYEILRHFPGKSDLFAVSTSNSPLGDLKKPYIVSYNTSVIQ